MATCLQTTKEKRQEKPFVWAIALSGQDLRIPGGQFQYVADGGLGSDLDSALCALCQALSFLKQIFFVSLSLHESPEPIARSHT